MDNPNIYLDPWELAAYNVRSSNYEARIAAIEGSMLIETAFVVEEDNFDFDSDGEILLAAFCAEADSVYKIRAQQTLRKGD